MHTTTYFKLACQFQQLDGYCGGWTVGRSAFRSASRSFGRFRYPFALLTELVGVWFALMTASWKL